MKTNDIKNFGRQFSDEEVKKYLDPFGFLEPNKGKIDKLHKEKEYTTTPTTSKTDTSKINLTEQLEQIENIQDPKLKAEVKAKSMPKEYGFKYNGPEPTRYGDWEVKGKCVDF